MTQYLFFISSIQLKSPQTIYLPIVNAVLAGIGLQGIRTSFIDLGFSELQTENNNQF